MNEISINPLEVFALTFCVSFLTSVLLIIYSACRVSGDISEREREDDYRWR